MEIKVKVKIVENFCPAPNPSPIAIVRNKYASSSGSFIAALNLTIDKAPTIPSDKTKFPLITIITEVVTKQTMIIEMLKLF